MCYNFNFLPKRKYIRKENGKEHREIIDIEIDILNINKIEIMHLSILKKHLKLNSNKI